MVAQGLVAGQLTTFQKLSLSLQDVYGYKTTLFELHFSYSHIDTIKIFHMIPDALCWRVTVISPANFQNSFYYAYTTSEIRLYSPLNLLCFLRTSVITPEAHNVYNRSQQRYFGYDD